MDILRDSLGDTDDDIRGFVANLANFGITVSLPLLQMFLVSLRGNGPFIKRKQTFKDEYDFIIVGGGSAGLVLANRLSEPPCVSVLALEAGGEAPVLTRIPSFARVFMGSSIDWDAKSTPQKYAAFGQKENRVNLSFGKVLGGSSTLNAMEYVRGNWENYNQWEAGGATGWGARDVFEYFLKLEDNRNIDELDEGYHTTGGPMTCEKVRYTPEHKRPVIEALKSMGYLLRDINGENQTGAYDLQMTTRNQERWSTDRAYLEPVRKRPNLDVLTNAYARKIVIEEESKKATGVEFDYKGKTYTVRARREVILANGALKTPQLLILSGIGPREQLEKLNIKPIAVLPVGKNLMDHVASPLIYSVSDKIKGPIEKNVNIKSALKYVLHRKGPLCSPDQIFLMAFVNGSDNTVNTIDFPLQELYFGEYAVLDMKVNLNVKDLVYDQLFKPYEGKPVWICFASILQPYSRGEVTLSSTDPYAMPDIDMNYFHNETDLKMVVEGMKACNAVARHPALKAIETEPLKTILPGCEEYVGDEDKYLTCWARHLVSTFWHYSGTAKMGAKDDPTSVVDPELRVIGVSNLRVVNAAIFPIIPSGNTNIPTIMTAEKASDIIKQNIHCEKDSSYE